MKLVGPSEMDRVANKILVTEHIKINSAVYNAEL